MSERDLAHVEIPSIEQVEAELSERKHKKEYGRALRNTICVLIVVAAIAVLISTLILPVLQASGGSMEPTLYDGDIIVLVKTDKYHTGELIGFYYQNKLLLKRVIYPEALVR